MYVNNVSVPSVGIMTTGTKTTVIKTANTVPAETVKPAAAENTSAVSAREGEGQLNVRNNNDSAKSMAAAYDTENDDRVADNEKIKKTIEGLSAPLSNSEIKFGIHEKTNRVTIKIVDKDSKKVIKEIPPEKTLNMIAKCMEIAGVLVDEKL